MNCEIFRKNLDLYMENQLPMDMKKSMKEHIDNCIGCRVIYEREKEMDDILSSVLSFEDIDFKSSRNEIIHSIDKNRYKKGFKNRVKFHLLKNKIQYVIAASFLAVVITIPMLYDFKEFGGSKKQADKSISMDIKDDKNITGALNSDAKQLANSKADDASGALIKLPVFEKTFNKVSFEILQSDEAKGAFNYEVTKGKVSPNQRFEAFVAGKGLKANEEGIGEIVISDRKGNSNKYYKINSTDGKQNSPLNIEWYDDNTLLVIVGLGYGTVAQGGNLYALNIDTGNTTLVYGVSNSKEQVTDIKILKNKAELYMIEYKDDAFNDYTKKSKVINFSIQDPSTVLNSKQNGNFSTLSNYVMLLNGESQIKVQDVLANGYDVNSIIQEKAKIVNNKINISKVIKLEDQELTEYIKKSGLSDVEVYGVEFLSEDKKSAMYQMIILGKESADDNWKIYYIYTPPQG